MLSKLSNILTQNKNILMLFSAGIYVLALYATLSEKLFLFSFCLTILLIYFLVKNLLPIKYILIWLLLFYFGVLNTSLRLKEIDELLNFAPVNCEITGTIVSIPQGFGDGKPKFFFDVNKIKFGTIEKKLKEEKVLVTLNSDIDITDVKMCNSFKLEGRLSAPFKAGNPSQFDYGNYLRNHSAYAVFYAKKAEKIEQKLTIRAKMLQTISDYRENIIKTHSKYLKSPNLEILGGIVFGDDAVSPPKDIKNSFANSGLLHILAASGMNVAFIYGFFFGLCSLLRINYRVNVIVGMIMVVIYSLMTGLGASIIRAAGMLLFVLAGKLIDRDAHSISLLAFVGLLMLLYNPLFINDVGFQLSFIVTFGLFIMTPAIVSLNNKVLDYVIGTITIPIIAQLWVIPIQIFYFNNISLYSVFANIMSVPILAVLSFGGFISALLSGIQPISDFVCKTFDFVLNPLLTLLVNISDFWGHLPNSTFQTTHPNVFQILLYFAILFCLSGLLYKELREKYFKKFIIAFFIFVSILFLTLIPIKNKDLEIITFDVGNADCFLIKSPNNDYIMIDTGKSGYKGGKSQAEIIMLKYLKDKGIKNLKLLIVTHFDNDHCGGAVDLLTKLDVKKLCLNDLEHKSYSAKNIYDTAKLKKTTVEKAYNNQIVYNNDGLRLTNLIGKSTDNDNENSIITLLEYKNFKILFTGDVDESGLREVLHLIPKNINVLKVPHHGALNVLNKELINHLNPEYSIISVGENKFGHPAQYTLEMLNKSIVYRTDIDNSILIKINNEGLNFYTFDIKRRKYLKQKKTV